MGVPKEPRQLRRVSELVDGVPQLVQERVRGVVVVGRVHQHADVTVPVDIDAEGVLALALAREEVAAGEDVVDVDPDAAERPLPQLEDVAVAEERVEVDASVRRCVLEERIRVVPGPQLAYGTAEPRGEPLVERSLPTRERLGGRSVAGSERVQELPFVELADRDRELEPVPIPERACGLVAQARQLTYVVRDSRADGLGRLPRLPALVHVVALAQDPLDRDVVDLARRG